MSSSSDGQVASQEQSFLSSEMGGTIVEEAREKMNADIINVNQFYPEITGGIKIYQDKYSFLADNAPDADVAEAKAKKASAEPSSEAKDSKEVPSVFATEPGPLPGAGGDGARSSQSNLLFLPEHWSARPKALVSMRQVMDDSTAEHYKQGTVAAKLGSLDEALAHFSKCISLRPREAIYYVRRAEIFLQLCDLQSAILNYKRACVLEPSNRASFSRLAFLYLLHGQTLFDQKLYPEALEAFSRAAEMRPDRAAFQTRSVACLAALQRHAECLALVNKRLEAEAASADLHVMRARLHNLFRNYSLCYYDLKDALGLDSTHPEASGLLAELARRARDFDARGVELALSGRTREALQRVSLAIEMDPTVADFHVRRGALHRRLGDFNAAIDDYLLALDKSDHREEAPAYRAAQRQLLLTFNDFALECFAKGYLEEALLLLNRAIRAEKCERGLYLNRGDCFYRRGELAFALADFQQALELPGTDDSAVRARMALVHHRMGQSAAATRDTAAADRHLSEALVLDPTLAPLWLARARARYGAGDALGARVDVLAALLLHPQMEGAEALVARLCPGMTLAEAAASPAAAQARREVERLVRAAMPQAVVEVSEARGGRAARAKVRRPRAAPEVGEWRRCRSEREVVREMIVEKKQVREQIKRRYREPESLRVGAAPRLLPLAPSSTAARRGGGGRPERLVDEKGKPLPSVREEGWRTFSLGIGIG